MCTERTPLVGCSGAGAVGESGEERCIRCTQLTCAVTLALSPASLVDGQVWAIMWQSLTKTDSHGVPALFVHASYTVCIALEAKCKHVGAQVLAADQCTQGGRLQLRAGLSCDTL